MHVISFRREKTWILVRRHRSINPERYSNIEDVVVQHLKLKRQLKTKPKASL